MKTNRLRYGYPIATVVGLALLALGGVCLPRSTVVEAPAANVRPSARGESPSGLPLPSRVPLAEFEEKLFAFLSARRYATPGWHRDKGVRDTGPFIAGKYYGTHPAVRVYYSPGVIRWLENGRVGPIPDGEMIVKEQFAPPAARHAGKSDAELWAALQSWTVMVKDSAGSHDGWFWSNPVKGQCVADNRRYPFDYPVSGFGLYCVRCHASTHSPGAEPAAPENEFTFAALRNVEGFPGRPITFRVDDSWRAERGKEGADAGGHPGCVRPRGPDLPVRRANPGFLAFFDAVRPARRSEVLCLPPVTCDTVPAGRGRSPEFVSSDQCMSCHAGLAAPFGPSLFVPFGKSADYGDPGWDVSPHGEWRWTPMGLAGRDPFFFAQIETEGRLIEREFRFDPTAARELRASLEDTCLRCHGVMGRRQLEADHPGQKFSVAHVLAADGSGTLYGALARDGVSCTVCHRMRPRAQPPGDARPYLPFFLETSITGNFELAPRGELHGPFADREVTPYPMEHATGWKPRQGEYLKSSRLCGSCHTVALPSIDHPRPPGQAADEVTRSETVPAFRQFHHHVEQATYLEWLNSAYENESDPAKLGARTCQDCHMDRGLNDRRHGIDLAQIRGRIAAVQDPTYPDAENLADRERLDVRFRESGYRRHNFAGLNVFLMELFRQGDDVLGVRKTDFMTGSKEGLANAAADMARRAGEETADVAVTASPDGPDRLTARVTVRNKTGHRFPTGVGFRRAFLELLVVETGAAERVVWASGRTNDLGVLLGADGRPLPTEFFGPDAKTGRPCCQPHHREITSPDQVQVYEILLQNARGEFTTSFVHGHHVVKDNRLLPRGWKPGGPGGGLAGGFLAATRPDAETARDPRYADGSGSDEVTYRIALPPGLDPGRLRVRATLYYQAAPPYFLKALFDTAPDGPATRRLHYLCSHIDLRGTAIEGWKLKVGSAEARVR